jgi:enoyl-CoA hydratase/carnithine racemase
MEKSVMSESKNTDSLPILFDELSCANEKRLAVVTLNVEKTLNSLTLEMVELMLNQLQLWRSDESIACVFIKGAGEKALCAGGDVQALYHCAKNKPGGPCEYAETFFAKEYQLDFLLHHFPKPVICWGGGIVMGGGLGIFAACSHRVVTEKTRLAMPEVTIGLYPDVGGSWFLNKMPDNVGMFLALTGAPVNGADSLFVGLADYFIATNRRDEFLDKLCSQVWSVSSDENREIVNRVFSDFTGTGNDELPSSNIKDHLQTINELCDSKDVFSIVDAIAGLNSDDKWLTRAQKTLLSGSPLSVLIIYRQLEQSCSLSMADVFRSELQLSTNIVRYPEFAEGVRALLIDKDNNPTWQYATAREIPGDVVDQFFKAPEFPAPWPSNPLENL